MTDQSPLLYMLTGAILGVVVAVLGVATWLGIRYREAR